MADYVSLGLEGIGIIGKIVQWGSCYLPENSYRQRQIKETLTSDFDKLKRYVLCDTMYAVRKELQEGFMDVRRAMKNIERSSPSSLLNNEENPLDDQELFAQELFGSGGSWFDTFHHFDTARRMAAEKFMQAIVKSKTEIEDPIELLKIQIFCSSIVRLTDYDALICSYKDYVRDVKLFPVKLSDEEKPKVLAFLNGISTKAILLYQHGDGNKLNDLLSDIHETLEYFGMPAQNRFEKIGDAFARIDHDVVRCFPMSGCTVAAIIKDGTTTVVHDIVDGKITEKIRSEQPSFEGMELNQTIVFSKQKQKGILEAFVAKGPQMSGLNFLSEALRRNMAIYIQTLKTKTTDIMLMKPYESERIYVVTSSDQYLELNCEVPLMSALVACQEVAGSIHIALIDRDKHQIIVLKSSSGQIAANTEFEKSSFDFELPKESRAVTISDSGQLLAVILSGGYLQLFHITTEGSQLKGSIEESEGGGQKIATDACFVNGILCICINDPDVSKPMHSVGPDGLSTAL